MASKSPEHLVSDNPNGIMFFGPAGSEDTTTEYTLHTKCGYDETVTKDGNRGTIIPGTYHEHVIGQKPGDNRKQKEKESISRSITAENGDICITAENGNIKLKAKNVYIETTGDGNDGSFMVSANEAVTITAGEQMTLGGAKICLSSADAITLNADGFIYLLCKDIQKGGPFSNLPFIPGPLKDLLDGIALSCK